jgi:hypothetical protein
MLRMTTERREALLSPHKREYERSVSVTMHRAVPKGVGQLVSWYLREWANEMPTAIHVNEVWRDWVRLDEHRSAEGGSLLGAHKFTDGFRQFIDDSPHSTDEEGRYVRPIRAALARLCGRGGHAGPTKDLSPAPFMARFLYRFGTSGDMIGSANSMGIPDQVAQVYAERALMQLFRLYSVGPNLLTEEAA